MRTWTEGQVPRARRGPADFVIRRLPRELANKVPRRYERLGDILLLKLPAEAQVSRSIAAAYAKVLGVRAVLAYRGVSGPWRQPDMDLVWGRGTETIHRENGVRFKLDTARIMFSAGNLRERSRMASVVRPGETVVDLFAGIGYYAIPMAVHGRPARVVACEINPESFRYLEENIRINRLGSVEARLGDCRIVSPRGVADRIVFGHLRGESFLDVAMRTARAGCVLHYHEAAPRDEIPARPWGHVKTSAREAGLQSELLGVHRVKSYAPRIDHVVLDVRLTR